MTPFSPVNYMQALRELQGLVFACMRLSSEDALVMLERGVYAVIAGLLELGVLWVSTIR